jgi:hypothetical protein
MSKKVLAIWVTVLLLIGVACNGPNGGIVIPASDSTGPTLALGAGQPSGQNITVNAGGSGQNMQLISKSGVLNLVATANDPESGIQAVEIWVNKRTISCDANESCSITPTLQGIPMFESRSPQLNPGDTTAASSILAQALDLSREISQGSLSAGATLTVDISIYAVAVNHLGGQTRTPEIVATWREP